MANNETLALAEAVRLTLAYCGAEVFADPQRFMSYLYEMTDNRSDEMRVLKNNCTVELLAPFVGADRMTSTDLKRAAAVAQEHLEQECQINAATSRTIARGLAEGVARWRELTIVWDDGAARAATATSTTPAPKPKGKRARWIAVALVVLGLVGIIVAAVEQAGFVDGSFPSLGTGGNREEEGIWVIVLRETKRADGTVTDSTSSSYDEQGNLLARNNVWLTDDESSTSEFEYSFGGFDKHGYPAWARSSDTDTSKDGTVTYRRRESTEYTYEKDARGRLKQRTSSTESASWFEHSGWDSPSYDEETTAYTYDGDTLVKRESRSTYVHDDYTSESVDVTEYDRFGHQTRFSHRSSSEGEVFSVWEDATSYQLRDDGTDRSWKRVYSTTYDDKTSVTTTTTTCDEHGNAVEETMVEDGVTTTTTYQNEYDKDGNLVRQKNLTEGSVTTYEYRYIADPSFAARHGGWLW